MRLPKLLLPNPAWRLDDLVLHDNTTMVRLLIAKQQIDQSLLGSKKKKKKREISST
jgi:hypothetical protein